MVNFHDDTVSVIDTTTNRVIDTNPNTPDEIDPIKVRDGQNDISYDPENKMMYVVNFRDHIISVIDTTQNTVLDTPQIDPIKVGKFHNDIAYDPENRRMYVTNPHDDIVSVIDTTKIRVIDTNPNTPDEIDPIRVGNEPLGIAYDPVNKRMYVTHRVDRHISVIDTTTNSVVRNPIGLEVGPS